VHADVLIIGAGPSGGAAALGLLRAGLSVVCLEQGHWPDRHAYRGGERDAELTSLKQWSWSPNVRGWSTDYALDLSDCDADIAMFNGVGGGSVLFNALWPRMTPNNFRSKTVAGYGADWPLDYAELQPYYERTDRQVGVSGLAGNPAYPGGSEPPLPPLPIFAGGLKVARGQAKLGWHWWPESNAILSTEYDDRHPCVARGTCMTGCGEGAKGSADLTYWRHVVALGGRLITGARVGRIVLDARGRAAGAEWYDSDGNGNLQTADVVLCAANGIGTPRLLLASATQAFPHGLANGSGLVGRNLMLHHHAFAVGIFEEPLETWRGHAGAWINSYEFYESDQSHDAAGTGRWALGGMNGTPLIAALGAATWGPDHHGALTQGFGRTLAWGVCAEDAASESNLVELSTDATDSAGVPVPVLHYRLADETRLLAAWHQQRQAESMWASGATTVVTPQVQVPTGHYMGTARMGDDPGTSVVDRFGMSHEIANLGILDASVFVTSAGVNPTSTVCALASRAVDKLVEHRSRIPRPELARSFWTGPRTVSPVSPDVPPPRIELSSQEQHRLDELADALLPAVDSRPSASEVGVGGHLGRAALAARPDLGAPLRRILAMPGEPALVLAQLAVEDPQARSTLELVVAGAYYMSPQVHEAIGYPGQQAHPARPDPFPRYIEEGLLDHMIGE
jgi:choline dehydrogenase-like flavoprotein